MELTLKLVYYLLGFNAVIVVMALSFYLLIGRRQKIRVDFEEYLASLPRDTVIRDPYVLVDGKWVPSNPCPPNSPTNP
jgi:hypothetical protein